MNPSSKNSEQSINGTQERRIKLRKYFANKKDFIEIQHLPKFAKVWIFCNDIELDSFEGMDKITSGLNYKLSDGRKISIEHKLNPYEFVIKLNGEYLPNTLHHPKNKLNSLYYLYVAVFILGIVSFTVLSTLPSSTLFFYMTIYLVAVGMLILGINFGILSLFVIGLIGFTIDTAIFTIFSFIDMKFLAVISVWILFRIYILFESYRKLKFVKEYNEYNKQLKAIKNNYDVVLDN